MSFGRGRGFRGGAFGGGGRGWRHRFYATGLPGWMRRGGDVAPFPYPAPYPMVDPGAEKQTLKSQAEALESALAAIKKRLSEIEVGAAAEQSPHD